MRIFGNFLRKRSSVLTNTISAARTISTDRTRASRVPVSSFFSAFTIAELLVVIVILAILATVGFLSYEQWTSRSRDTQRGVNIRNISTSLELFRAKTETYPDPDSLQSITFSGGEVWKQGIFWPQTNLSLGGILSKTPSDPKWSNHYTYSVLSTKKAYEISSVFENTIARISPVFGNIAYASEESTSDTPFFAYVQGTYNGQAALSKNGSSCALIATPSIILADIPVSGKLEDAGNGSLVIDRKQNIPHSYANSLSSHTRTGAVRFLDYSRDSTKAILSDSCTSPADAREVAVLGEKLKQVYKDSEFAIETDYRSVSSSVDKASYLLYGKSTAENVYGGSITLTAEDSSQIAFNCATPTPTSATILHAVNFTFGTPKSFDQAWIYSDTPSNCSFSCETGYVFDPSKHSCELNQCSGAQPAHSELSVGSASAYLRNWHHQSTGGDNECRFECSSGYVWDTPSSSCLPKNCSETTVTANTRTYTIAPTFSHNETRTLSENTNISGGSYTVSYDFRCEYGVLSSVGSELITPHCDTNYAWSSGSSTCVANTQTSSCGTLPENSTASTASTYSQTWNGSIWAPTYSWTNGGSTCGFACNTNYTWSSGSSSCVANTRSASCGGSIPANAAASTASTYTQTWNGSAWAPTLSWSNAAGSCGFTCNSTYTWNSSSCAENRVTITLNISGVNNYNIFANRGGTYVAGRTDMVVNVSGTIGSAAVATPALDTGTGWATGDTITIVNNGMIIGMTGTTGAYGTGGAGGAGGTSSVAAKAGSPGTAGWPGGAGWLGLKVQWATRITNNGTISGGRGWSWGLGGGGGGGGGRYYGGNCSANGGSGGKGQGSAAAVNGWGGQSCQYQSDGGSYFNYHSGSGWKWGAYGAAGSPGTGGSGGGSGGAGGAAGATGATGATGTYVTGNAYVTWIVAGTRTGTTN